VADLKDLVRNYKSHLPFAIICAVVLGLGTFLAFVWFQFQLNPDAGSYYTIAQKYADGDIRHAINGYWGPMLSWLLVPAVWMGANLIIASKIISLLAGVGTLILVYRFLLTRKVSLLITNIVCLGLAGLMIGWATAGPVTPDLLMVLLIVWFAFTYVGFLSSPTRKTALLLGLIGALLYFTKGFGFYLFLGVSGLLALWQWRSIEHDFSVVFKRYLPMAAVFFVLVLPFIGAISAKYHKLTINNAGDYDHHIYGPVGQAVAPMSYKGPLQPPNDTAMSVWEDPTLLTNTVPGWNPFGSWKNFGFFMNSTIGRNLNTAVHGIYAMGPFVALAITGLIAGLMQRKKHMLELRFFAGLSVLMIAGYSLVLIDTRYLFPLVVLAATGSALFLSGWQQKKILSGAQILVGGLLVCAVSLLFMGQSIVQARDLDKHWYLANNSIREFVPKNSNIISDDFPGSFFACHHLQLHCYSVMSPPIKDDEMTDYYQLLKDQKVTYFIDYHTRETNRDMYRFVNKYYTKVGQKLTEGHLVTVYKLR
jgi:hypothetical protein